MTILHFNFNNHFYFIMLDMLYRKVVNKFVQGNTLYRMIPVLNEKNPFYSKLKMELVEKE